ncbi:hypothetical protein F751_4917 [Auxenochlorella protothecoides]|uniref:26S proteasome complex subunit SEM1 n=1 Tax=Auxenochlorella protothecoides TaxID=3075 RepID=A0A087SMA2_AUXPR|nr:hypothetical protein F751_4917 [Auxenochlorella protothecoides]KFM26856.1 hypothetical protein F751_4917 [Auxenochlorella protothecoides]
MANPAETVQAALQNIENEDEFEEFEVEEWDESKEDPANSCLWEQDWDDDDINNNFAERLKAELANLPSDPLAVLWEVEGLSPCDPADVLPAAARAGVALFQNLTSLDIAIPIAWSAMHSNETCSLGLRLTPLSGSASVRPQLGTAALIAFPLPPGTCPPGTAVAGASQAVRAVLGSASDVNSTADGTVSGAVLLSRTSRLLALAVRGQGNSSLTLSARQQGDQEVYAAMVENGVENVTLCAVPAEDYELRVRLNTGGDWVPAQGGACPCRLPGGEGLVEASSAGAGANETALLGAGPCSSWRLDLGVGPNQFDLVPRRADGSGAGNEIPGEGSAAAVPASTPGAPPRGAPPSSLSVVRRAPPSHVRLASLNLTTPAGTTATLCAAAGAAPRVSAQSLQALALADGAVDGVGRCIPGVRLNVSVPAPSEFVSLRAGLAFPHVEGIRVEAGGQVLTRGGVGDGADADGGGDALSFPPTAPPETFLPAAFVMRLPSDMPVDLDVLVVAEDGVTSARYPLRLLRRGTAGPAGAARGAAGAFAPLAEGPAPEPLAHGGLEEEQGPLQAGDGDFGHGGANCTACPPGWASSTLNASACTMCPPGTQASQAQASTCQSCPAGSYSYSWGASACQRCMAGTFSSGPGSTLCRLCPSGAGVAASPADIVAALIRADTAVAFNVSLASVSVSTAELASRRTLRAVVSASLDVAVPDNATAPEIAAALEVQRLSADAPIAWLADDPDSFFARTTQTLAVTVTAGGAATQEVRPDAHLPPLLVWPLAGPGLACLGVGLALLLPLLPRGEGWGRRLRRTLSPRRAARSIA